MAMTQSSADYFRRVAGDWDQISAGYFGKSLLEAALAKAYLRPEMAVADVGGGTGFVSAGVAPLVKRVYLVDGSAEMLEVAKRNLAGFSNVEYHQADGSRLPFPDESLEVVFANMYLHHTADPLAAIREMIRVLVPGGRLVITDMEAHPYAWLKDEMADVWQGFDRAQIRAWFQSTGLVNVIVEGSGQSCCPESSDPAMREAQGQQANISIFVATGTRRMSMRDAVLENYAAIAQANSSCGCGQDEADGCCGGTAGGSNCCEGTAGGSNCCGGSPVEEVSFVTGYSQDELSAAPQEAAGISLGCGNPFKIAAIQPGEVVLDIGSGGGLDAFLAAKKVGPAGRVIGVDMTPAMLERARATAGQNGITNVEFRQGDAEHLPVGDGEVDLIISNCVINLVEDKGQVFAEAFRVLKPGGRLAVSDVVTSGSLPLEVKISPSGWAECITGALPEREYLDLIAQAGFCHASAQHWAQSGRVEDVLIYSAVIYAEKPGDKPSGDCCASACSCK